MTPPLTAGQRAELARLRILHPRARVTVPALQRERPLIRVRMRWAIPSKHKPRHNQRIRIIWLAPDGRRLYAAFRSGQDTARTRSTASNGFRWSQ